MLPWHCNYVRHAPPPHPLAGEVQELMAKAKADIKAAEAAAAGL